MGAELVRHCSTKPLAALLITTLFACLLLPALLAPGLSAQSGIEKKKIKDMSRRVARVMEKGSRDERMEKIDEMVEMGKPWLVPIIANGVAVSYKRTERMSRKVLAMMERNAELYKRLKIQAPQRRGDRTKNDEINGNLDLIEQFQDLQAEERRFRRTALKATRKMVVKMEEDKKQ